MVEKISNEEEAGPFTAPVTVAERLPSLDVLRGFALLGILVLNVQDFASPTGILHDIPLDVVSRFGAHHTVDVAIMTFQWLFFEGKMRALFSILFGAGSVLLLERIERRQGEGRAADIFHRRNMWLVLFGLIHGALIWAGDILLIYGLLALLTLYPLRHVAGKYLIYTGLVLSLAGGTLGISNAMGLGSALKHAMLQESARTAQLQGQKLTTDQVAAVQEAAATRNEELARLPKAVADGRRSYLQSEPDNASGDAAFIGVLFTTGWVFEVGGLLVAGMGLYKTGFLSGGLASKTYWKVAAIGYAISIPTVLIGLHHSRLFGFSDAVTTVWMFLPYGVEQVACMLANASLILLLVKGGVLLSVQRALAAVGRTAFTNYIMTSVVCQFLFKWGPWKLYGALEFHQDLYVVIGVWTLNVLFSTLWLSVFAFGPLEWIWRSLTYWKRQPWLRKRTA
jgi:uncharacterized protein